MEEKEKKRIKIPVPEEVLEKFLNWFDSNKRVAFLMALIFGVITHITMITETVMSQDGIWNSMQYSRAGDWELSLGRWGIEFAQRLNNFIAVPSITTIMCIFFMAIAAVFLVDIFGFKSKYSAAFTGIILVVSPCLTATMLYVYTTVAYCLDMLLTIMAIWFIYKFKYKKIGMLLATVCFAFALSIYQSYMGVTIGLCIMLSIIELLKDDSKIKDAFINIGKTVGVVLVGGILYYVLTMILQKVSGIDMASYLGANELSIAAILSSFGTGFISTYKNFLQFFFTDKIVLNSNYSRQLWYAMFYMGFALAYIIRVIKLKCDTKKEKILKIILSTGMLFALPFGLNIINIIAIGVEIYPLTGAQLVLMIPFAFAIFELKDVLNISKWMMILGAVCITGTYYLASNTSYSALKLTYNQAYSSTMRVLDRIENTEGYEKNMPLCLAGIIGNNNYPRTMNLYGYTIGELANNTVFHGTYGGQIGTWHNYMRVFYGLDINLCDHDTYYKLVTSDEYKEMEMFPSKNSIKIINGVVVVKLSEEPPLPY